MLAIASLAQCGNGATAQQPSINEAKRSVAAVMPTPGAIPPKRLTSPRTSGAKTAYSKKVLQDAARRSYPRTHLEKGYYLKQKNDPNGALLEFLKATQENPHMVKGFYEQALIFRSRGYRKLAASSLEQALAIQPNYNEARVLLATVRLEQGNLGGAVQELSRSLGLDSAIAQEGSPDSKTMSTQPSSGLLSIDIPAILQSIHGVIKAPPSNSVANAQIAEKSKSVEHGDESKSENSKTDPAVTASAAAPEIETERARKKRLRKEKHKKSLLSHLHGADETTDSGRESGKDQPSKKEVQTDIANGSANKESDHTTNPAAQISLTSLLNAEKKSSLPRYSEVPTFSSGHTSASSAITSDIENGHESNTSDTAPASNASDSGGIVQEISNADKAAGVFGNNDTFSAPQPAIPISGLLSTILSSPFKSGTAGSAGQPAAAASVKLDDDEWAKKLKSYAEHGANALKTGEAFMFAEDTGEASLFLADGTTIRRIVAQPKDSNEVMRERRPDITSAEDMLYGLSLLGKLIPKMDNQQPASPTPAVAQPIGSFRGDNLMSGSQTFWGWLKSVLKI